MKNKYRLASSAFERETEEEKIELQKIYFISVEGNITEKEYLEGLSSNREELGINAKVDVEVLRRGKNDTNSAPKQVLELLEEYIQLRQVGQQNLLNDIPEEFVEQYGIDFIQCYLENPESIARKERNRFVTDLMKIGYDINYRKYLQKYNNELDEFAILIDRDMQTHSEISMKECIAYCCQKKHYKCYIANPCFEFWLLLHLSDVKEEYKDRLEEIRENSKVSDSHTFISKEVSNKAHHGKGGINFKKNYLPNVENAVERAKKFASDEDSLIENIGCNLWKLIESMKKYEVEI
ncbi:MAG: RloB domain-containing protein [Roseburia sp.]|nr:RloB domain-containing protein [Roseburia sp.]